MLVLVADTQMIGAGSREGGGCRAWKGVVVYGRGCRAWKGVVVHVGSGACQRRKGCSFERTGARVEKRDAQRVRTYQPPLVIVLAPLKRRLESHVRRHRARWGWRGAARCELRLKRGGKRAPRGQHQRDRKQAQHPVALVAGRPVVVPSPPPVLLSLGALEAGGRRAMAKGAEKTVVDTSGILNVAMQSHPSAQPLPPLDPFSVCGAWMVRACERRAVVV